MMFGKNNTPYSVESAASGSWRLSTLAILLLVLFILIAIVFSYFLGLRAGQSSGLELAHQNSLAQVMRMPVSKAIEERLSESNEDSQDIYKELGRTSGIKETGQDKIEKVSEGVKEFLKTTPTIAPKLEAETQEAIPQISPKKIENVNAIKQALEQVNNEDSAQIRVINPVVEEVAPNQKEDFDLTEKSKTQDNPIVAATVKVELIAEKTKQASIKPTIAPTKTPEPKKTATPKATAIAAFKKLNSGWYTQVAAPKSLNDAQALTAKLKASGFKAHIENAQVADQQYFRVLVGPDNSKLAAEQTLFRLRNKARLPAEPFVRLVK